MRLRAPTVHSRATARSATNALQSLLRPLGCVLRPLRDRSPGLHPCTDSTIALFAPNTPNQKSIQGSASGVRISVGYPTVLRGVGRFTAPDSVDAGRVRRLRFIQVSDNKAHQPWHRYTDALIASAGLLREDSGKSLAIVWMTQSRLPSAGRESETATERMRRFQARFPTANK